MSLDEIEAELSIEREEEFEIEERERQIEEREEELEEREEYLIQLEKEMGMNFDHLLE